MFFKYETTRVKLKKYKKRMMTTVNNNPQHPISSLIVDGDVVVCSLIAGDDVIIYQILTRLPVKSLMRFKCVCKRWITIIEEDSYFIDLHLRHSGRRSSLFVLLQKNAELLTGFYKSFLPADLHFNGRDAGIQSHSPSNTQSLVYGKILGPIGGLICFVNIFSVRIYNVGTREVTPWISSAVFSRNMQKDKREKYIGISFDYQPHCSFGFDPTTKEHKVIFIWCKLRACEVMTVGDYTWRAIDELPPYVPHTGMDTVSANGSVYWNLLGDDKRFKLRSEYYDSEFSDSESSGSEDVESSTVKVKKEYTERIMAFDIGSEKFRVIPVPAAPKYEHDESFCLNKFSLSVVDGCLAVIRQADRKVKMWISRDQNKENGTSELDWTRLSINFPSELTVQRHQPVIYVHSVLGRDQIILETYRDDGNRNVMAAVFYSYDRKKKMLRKLEINGIKSIPEDCSAICCSTFVESLLPVQKKLQQQRTEL